MSSVTYIFFPIFNEGSSAGNLVKHIHEACDQNGIKYHILAVDDGSSDDSVEHITPYAATVPLTLLRHECNLGLRKALETGLQWLAANVHDNDVVVLMDGDDSHDPLQIPQMLEQINDNARDVVIASRYRKGAAIHGLAWHRKYLSLGSAVAARIMFAIPGVRDYTCGFRAVRGRLIKKIWQEYDGRVFELQGYGFICSVELLLRLAEFTAKFAEIPMVLRYDRKIAPSKMDTRKMIAGFFALWRHKREGNL